MKAHFCEQGGAEWLALRTGRITASEVADATAMLKRKSGDKSAGESSGTRDSYIAAMVAEIMTGQASQHYVSRWMERGQFQEPFARAAYETRYEVMVDQVGFVEHPTIARSGASPDGIIGGGGCLEIKVPKIETHLKYMFAGVLPADYEPQVMWQMACTGYEWCDFISFCPELPARHQIFKVRVQRNEDRIAELEDGVLKCLAEVDSMIERLNRLNPDLDPPIRPKSKAMRDLQDSLSEALLTDEIIDAYII